MVMVLGKPTFNYDMYNFNLVQYDGSLGYYGSTQFAEILDRINAVEESTLSASEQTIRQKLIVLFGAKSTANLVKGLSKSWTHLVFDEK